jgi:ATP-dependent Clp protease protease subunit
MTENIMSPEELLQQPHIIIGRDIDQEAWEEFLSQERVVREKALSEILILLSSKGGDCYYARAIYDRICLLAKSVKVNIVVSGPCMSSAVSPIWMAVAKDQRFVTPSAVIVVHQTQSHKDVPMLGAYSSRKTRFHEIESHLVWEERDFNWMMELIASQTNHSLEEIKQAVENAKFFDAKEAIAFGWASRII